MSADAVIYSLLSGAAGVTALVSTRIYPAVAPEGTAMPLIAFELVSSVRMPRIDAQAADHLVRARVQVNLLAVGYAGIKALRAAVVAACQFQRGTIASVTVVSVLPDGDGPITFDSDLGLFHQPIDFMITLFE